MNRLCEKKEGQDGRCERPAAWRPILLLRPTGYEGQPLKAYVNLALCDTHRSEVDVNGLLGAESWAQIVETLRVQGIRSPSRELAQVIFDPIGMSTNKGGA